MICRAEPSTLPMMHGEKLIVDLFAGGGGWSQGTEEAFTEAGQDRLVDLAVNHNPTAIACHGLNHPHTVHHCKDVFEVWPLDATGGLPVGYLHASPDCTHHSKARGGKPVKKNIRGLAWVVIRWARLTWPDVITLENVEEFRDWGPLTAEDKPDPKRKGQTFKTWVTCLERLGYVVEHRILKACDYGAPTTRKRLFIIARRDGRPIVWPEVTHGDTKEIHAGAVDRASTSKGQTGEKITQNIHAVERASLRVHSHVISNGISSGGCTRVRAGSGGWGSSSGSSGDHHPGLKPYRTAAECIDWSLPMCSIFATPEEAKAWAKLHGVHRPRRPLAENTLRRIAAGVMRYVVNAGEPFIVPIQNYGWGQNCTGATEPLRTVTATPKGGAFAVADAVVAPLAVDVNHGVDEKTGIRARSLDRPHGVVTGSHGTALVSAFLSKHYGGVVGHGVERPLGAVTGVDHHALTSAHLVKFHGERKGWTAQHALNEPLRTMDTSNRFGLVAAFLAKYYGNDEHGQSLDRPMDTVVGQDRFGLVTVALEGELWAIVDIAMRMLTPRELARATGFPDDYVIDRGVDGKMLSKRDQVKLIGNAVPPAFARAIVRENVVVPGILNLNREVA